MITFYQLLTFSNISIFNFEMRYFLVLIKSVKKLDKIAIKNCICNKLQLVSCLIKAL